MTLTAHPTPLTESTPGARTTRDASVDVARAWCLTIVVALHALMVGVSVVDGAPVIENAMDGWDGFAALTWFAQIMPLFFVLGGFSSATQWAKLRGRGTPPHQYLALRLQRLLPAALGAIAATAGVLLTLDAAGVPDALVAEAGFRLSQPLWFLGVYLLCTGLVPVMTALHRAAPRRVLGVLTVLVIVVDAVRLSTGIDAIGFVNLLLVWLLVQQLGFRLADGRWDGVSRRRLVTIGGAALAALAALCLTGAYSPDLLQNLNPPTFALVLLGVAQLCLFQLMRPALRRMHGFRAVGVVVAAVNARAMTVYAWHMLVLIGLAGVLLVSGGETLPAPLTEDWWATRAAWLLAVGAAVVLVVAAAGRLETAPARAVATRHPLMAPVALLGAAGAVLLVLVCGATPLVWAASAAVLAISLRATREDGSIARCAAAKKNP